MEFIMEICEKIQGFLNNIFPYFTSLRRTTPTESMEHNIFISYSNNDVAIVENLRSEFRNFGVNSWVYSKDRSIGKETWDEIENKIRNADIVIFIVSESTANSPGQERELELARKLQGKILPIFLTEKIPSNCPDVLRNINGHILDAFCVKSVALEIVKCTFPSLIKNKSEGSWNYPIPGTWLEISHLDRVIEQYFDIGEKLYFRAISPMGLFECYAPKIKGLFWITPENVRPCLDTEKNNELEKSIPKIFTVMVMVDIQTRGWDSYHKSRPDE
jgi:hypothetical protein